LGWCSLFCVLLLLHVCVCGHRPPAACTVACMRRLVILSLGVVFPVLLRVVSSCMRPASCIAPAPAFLFLRPVFITSILYAPYPKRSLMARAFLPFLKWSGPISCSCPRGFESHLGGAGGHCPYSVPIRVFITPVPPIPSAA
jgi:hypothetical protein